VEDYKPWLANRPGQNRARLTPATIAHRQAFFQTSIEFRPTLQAQHDDAAAKHHSARAQLFDRLLHRTAQDAS